MGVAYSVHVEDEKSSCPRHEVIGGSIDTAPLIPNLGTRWRRAVNLTPRMLYPGIH